MVKQPDIHIDLDTLNDSELARLCQWVGFINASRAWPRWLLIQSLETFQPVDIPGPTDEMKHKLSTWLVGIWERVQMQAQKKACPQCFSCRELQAMDCHLLNKKYYEGR